MSSQLPVFRTPRRQPMSNAERQQRWRDTHRPRKRKALSVPPGMMALMGLPEPPGFVAPPPVSQPAPTPTPTPTRMPTPVAAPPAPEHNYCPHCGSCLRKRAKTPKLAA